MAEILTVESARAYIERALKLAVKKEQDGDLVGAEKWLQSALNKEAEVPGGRVPAK